MRSPVAGSSLTTSLSSSLVSSQRLQGNLYFSFVNVFKSVTFGDIIKELYTDHKSYSWKSLNIKT